jgi:hypothetical protein
MYTYSCEEGKYKHKFAENYETALIVAKKNLQCAGANTAISWLLSLS